MAGLMIFGSVSEALRAGFAIYERTENGYLARTRTANGWALALVRPAERSAHGRQAGFRLTDEA